MRGSIHSLKSRIAGIPAPAEPQPRTIPFGAPLLAVGALVFALALWACVEASQAWGYAWNGGDLYIYFLGAHSVEDHSDVLYSAGFGPLELPFIYPPFAALTFSWIVPDDFMDLKEAMSIVTIACTFIVCWIAWGMLGYRRTIGRLGAALATAGVCLWLVPVNRSLQFGQINMLLLTFIVADVATPDRRGWKGVGIGLATAIKLTPGLFVVYLLLTRRFRAAGVAIGTFLATVVFAWFFLPGASKTYWTNVSEIGSRVNNEIPLYALDNQTLKGFSLRLFDGGFPGGPVAFLLAAAVVVLGLASAVIVSQRGHELAAATLVGLVGLLMSPLSWSHHYVWAVPALVLLLHWAFTRRTIGVWAALIVFAVIFASIPMARPDYGPLPDKTVPLGLLWLAPDTDPLGFGPAEFFFGNSLVFVGSLAVVVAAIWSWRSIKPALSARSSRPAAPEDTAAQQPEPRAAGRI
ncbi:glycosyltransferase 87 family protein [Yinghuangia sp. YIM S10712]|uniref:glycosyltransferase 87 family protein n=1 Tax=Yinghuangia sp. YIM S10712 TaxID=3436930 RepID=UPI003F52CBB6